MRLFWDVWERWSTSRQWIRKKRLSDEIRNLESNMASDRIYASIEEIKRKFSVSIFNFWLGNFKISHVCFLHFCVFWKIWECFSFWHEFTLSAEKSGSDFEPSLRPSKRLKTDSSGAFINIGNTYFTFQHFLSKNHEKRIGTVFFWYLKYCLLLTKTLK